MTKFQWRMFELACILGVIAAAIAVIGLVTGG